MRISMIAMLLVICIITMGACSSVEQIEEVTPENISEETNSEFFLNKDDYEVEAPKEAIGGEHMGDELISPYSGYVDTIIALENTFSEQYYLYIGDFLETKWDNNRPALMYHLAREMKLTRDDIETYFTALGCENVPESVYSGLLADTLEESMQLLKTEYAFYNNGKLYTIYDVYEMNKAKTLTFDVTSAEYDSVWESINTYLNSEYAYEVGENITQFVTQKVDAIK